MTFALASMVLGLGSCSDKQSKEESTESVPAIDLTALDLSLIHI